MRSTLRRATAPAAANIRSGARVTKLVDVPDLKFGAARRTGSSPVLGTIHHGSIAPAFAKAARDDRRMLSGSASLVEVQFFTGQVLKPSTV